MNVKEEVKPAVRPLSVGTSFENKQNELGHKMHPFLVK